MYKNYIFDLYGTLIDINTNEWSAYIWKKMQEYYGFYGAEYTSLELKKAYFRICKEQEDKLKKTINDEYPEIQVEYVFKEMFENKGVEITIEKCRELSKFFRIVSTKYIKLYDGVIELMDELKKKNKKIYLLSNAQQSFTEYEIKFTGLYDYFDGIMMSSDEGCKKPSKNFFGALFSKYNLEKKKSIMIGNDWISDIGGANSFGIDSLYIHTNISPRDTVIENVKAKYIIEDADFKKIEKMIIK